MSRLIRNIILVAVAIIAVPAGLLRFFRAGAGAARATDDLEGRPVRSSAKRWTFRIAALLVIAGLGGFLVVASGIMPIKASSGHWAITAWFLNFAMRRSVVTHSLMIEPPPVLDDHGLVVKGAGHYDFGCRPCHGSPDSPMQPRIPQAMTPHPPNLSREIPKWNADELFYIVKHGVKFTGMPAWPAQARDDEVWAVVAFLRKLPQLSAPEYRKLVHGTSNTESAGPRLPNLLGAEDVPRTVVENCARCHGVEGNGRELGVFPILAGQKPAYLFAALAAYARGERHSGIMEPIAAGLSSEAMVELARYYAGVASGGAGKKTSGQGSISSAKRLMSSHEWPGQNFRFAKVSESSSSDVLSSTLLAEGDGAAAVERGRKIARVGIPSRRIPACVECHGPSAVPRNPYYPLLAGQYAEYLVLQLSLFKKEIRGGSPYAHLMREVVAQMTEQQMRDVALYYASLAKDGGEP